MRKTEILKSVQARLADAFPQVKYIDKDWGQLEQEVPAVGFPCILLDVERVEYTDMGGGWQLADATLTVTVANQRTNASSAHAPSAAKNLSYYALELTEQVHRKLQGFHAAVYSPLTRTRFDKVASGARYECYEMRYETQYKCPPAPYSTAPVRHIKITPAPWGFSDGLDQESFE